MRVEILGTLVDKITMEDALAKVEAFIREEKPRHIITLNAEIIYRAQTEARLKKVINQADLVTPDGAGVVWASHKLGDPLPERVTGIDLMLKIAEQASQKGWKLYLYGAAPGVAKQAARNLEKNFTGIKIVGTKHGFLSSKEMDEMIAHIKAQKPQVLFVALGAPRQEYWIREHLEELQVPVCMGVGGSFDVISGKVKRAPKIFQDLHLEWFYRLLKEPKRFKRMLALPKFVLKIMQETRKKKRS